MARTKWRGTAVATAVWTAALLAGVAPAAASTSTSTCAATEAVVVRGPSATAAAAAVLEAGGSVVRRLDLVGGVAARVSASAADRLIGSGLAVDPDDTARVTSDSFAPFGADAADTQLTAVDPGPSWDLQTGAGVAVALVDTGVDERPDLAGRLVHGVDLSSDHDDVDHYGHGTFMAGLIAGGGSASAGSGVRHTGVAPGATVVSVKVADADGSTTVSTIIAGIGWAVDHADQYGIGVLNLSFGAPPHGSFRADPMSAAVEAAWASGLTVVVAAGNDGAGRVTSPGRDPWVLTAGSTDTAGTATTADDTVPAFSGSGDRDGVRKPDVAAPGVSVISLRDPGSAIDVQHPSARVGDDYFVGTGTSMATAEIAGAAAVLLATHPDATPDDVKGAVIDSAAPVRRSRAGALDLAAALAMPAADWDQAHGAAGGDDGEGDGDVVRMPWSATRWSATRWSATRWSATRWSATRWSATRWSATRWSATRWSATRWSATRWSATRWSATRWSATRWSDVGWGTDP